MLHCPSSHAFERYHRQLVSRLGVEDRVVPARVEALTWSAQTKTFSITARGAQSSQDVATPVRARFVVFAGGSHAPNIPQQLKPLISKQQQCTTPQGEQQQQ